MVKGITWEAFFSEYWRKKPLFVKGGAIQWLNKRYETTDFERMVQDVEKHDPSLVKRNANKVTFVQKIDLGDPHLQQLVQQFKQTISCPSIWFDGVRADHDHGIGCHFDDSDNFVLQQQGTKIWKLHNPEIIPEDILQRRMLKQPIGNIYMPDEYIQFILEPGDLLYIPIFWPHWGVSVGSTLSLSLVCNCSNAVQELLPIIEQLLTKIPSWWRPLPQLKLEKSPTDGQLYPDHFDQMLESLLEVFQQETFRQQLKSSWKRQRYDHIHNPNQTVNIPSTQVPKEVAVTQAVDSLQIDIEKVQTIFTQRVDAFDLKDLVMPTNRKILETFQTLKFRLAFKRFLLLCDKSFELMESKKSRESLQKLVNHLLSLEEKQIQHILLRPELSSWAWRLHEAIDFAFPPRLEQISDYLGTFLLSSLIKPGELEEGEWILFARSTEYTIQLWTQGIQIHTTKPLTDRLLITCEKNTLQIADQDELLHKIPVSLLRTPVAKPAKHGDIQIEPLSVSDRILLSHEHDWWERFFPKNDQNIRLSGTLLASQRAGWEDQMKAALSLLRNTWLEGYEELVSSISCLKPLSQPISAVFPAFRGLILIGKQKDPTRAAQLLVGEMGRTKLYDLLDLYLLIKEDQNAEYLSPCSGTMQPALDIIADLLATLYQLALLYHLPDKEVDHTDRQRLIEQSRESLSLLKNLDLTAEGERVWLGCKEVLQRFGDNDE